MARWLLFRLVRVLLATWGIASLVFLLSRQGLSLPEQQALAQADVLHGPHLTADSLALAQARHRLGLDRPVFYVTYAAGRWHWQGLGNQYHYWLRELAHGRLGVSYRNGEPVTAQLGPALANTLPLVGTALVLGTGLALLMATYLAAGYRATPGRTALRAGLTGLQALPLFVFALLLLLLLANPEVLNILPATGTAAESWPAAIATAVLPLLALVLAGLPEQTLPLVATLRHELASPYAIAARAKGLTTRQVVWRHALPNAVLPLLAALTEQVPTLVAGAVVVEVLFARPGMGRLLAEAAATRDYPVLLAGVLLAAAARLLALLAADLFQYYLDPRLRTPAP